MSYRIRLSATLFFGLTLLTASSFQASAQEEKLPVPGAQQRKEKRMEVAEIFDLGAQRDRDQKRDLARQLADAADGIDDDSAAMFVLLNMAREIAANTGDIKAAIRSIDTMQKHFEFDSFPVRVLTLRQANAVTGLTTSQKSDLLSVGKTMLDRKILANDYEIADKLCDVVLKIARDYRNPVLIKAVQKQRQTIDSKLKLERGLVNARLKIQVTPEDPEANFVVGRAELLRNKDWNAAIPFFAKCTAQPELVVAASKDQSVDSPQTAFESAKAWIDASSASKDVILKDALLVRALLRFREAKDGLKGLMRVIAEREIKSLERLGIKAELGPMANVAASPTSKTDSGKDGPINGGRLILDNVVDLRWAKFDSIDILKRIDVVKDKIRHDWTKRNGVLYSANGPYSRIRLPVVLPEQYDLLIDCKFVSGTGNVAMRLTTSQGQGFVINLDGFHSFDVSGLSHINGKPASENATRYQAKLFKAGEQYRIKVSVRRNKIVVSVDEKEIIKYEGPETVFADDLDVWFDKQRLTGTLGAYDSVFEFRSVVCKQVRDHLSDSDFPPRTQIESGDTRAGFRRGDTTLPSRIANARKIYLDQVPEAAFAVGHGTLGRGGKKGYDGESKVWINKQPVAHALSVHPASYQASYVAYHLDENFKTLTIEPGISEYAPPRQKEPISGRLRFAIYGDGRLLKAVDDVFTPGIAASWRLDVRNVRSLLLMCECSGSASSAHGIWANPLLEK